MKMLFVMTNLKSGGIASSLVSLLKEIKIPEIKVDLLLFNDMIVRKDLPDYIHVKSANSLANLVAISNSEIRAKSKALYLVRILLGGWTRVFGDRIPYNIICATNKKLTGYDVAISCTQSAPKNNLYGGCNELVLRRVNAKQKIAFIHCDYVKYGINTKYSEKIYSQFDKIATVSDSSKKELIKSLPNISTKIFTVYNSHDYKRIINLSSECSHKISHDVINIVSVARIGKEKGHLRALGVFERLRNEGKKFRWHIIGEGDKKIETNLFRAIAEKKLSDCVITYGNLLNPYEIVKQCDALLVMSYHECAPMVYNEAYALGVPVLSTETLSAQELVSSKGYGIVCKNNERGLYEMLKMVMNDSALLTKCRCQIKKTFKDTNEESVKQFWRMIYG